MISVPEREFLSPEQVSSTHSAGVWSILVIATRQTDNCRKNKCDHKSNSKNNNNGHPYHHHQSDH